MKSGSIDQTLTKKEKFIQARLSTIFHDAGCIMSTPTKKELCLSQNERNVHSLVKELDASSDAWFDGAWFVLLPNLLYQLNVSPRVSLFHHDALSLANLHQILKKLQPVINVFIMCKIGLERLQYELKNKTMSPAEAKELESLLMLLQEHVSAVIVDSVTQTCLLSLLGINETQGFHKFDEENFKNFNSFLGKSPQRFMRLLERFLSDRKLQDTYFGNTLSELTRSLLAQDKTLYLDTLQLMEGSYQNPTPSPLAQMLISIFSLSQKMAETISANMAVLMPNTSIDAQMIILSHEHCTCEKTWENIIEEQKKKMRAPKRKRESTPVLVTPSEEKPMKDQLIEKFVEFLGVLPEQAVRLANNELLLSPNVSLPEYMSILQARHFNCNEDFEQVIRCQEKLLKHPS